MSFIGSKIFYVFGIVFILIITGLIILIINQRNATNTSTERVNTENTNQKQYNLNNEQQLKTTPTQIIDKSTKTQNQEENLSKKETQNKVIQLQGVFIQSDNQNNKYDFFVKSVNEINGFQLIFSHSDIITKYEVNKIFDAKLSTKLDSNLFDISYAKLNNLNKNNEIVKIIDNERYLHLFSIDIKNNSKPTDISLDLSTKNNNIVIFENGEYGYVVL